MKKMPFDSSLSKSKSQLILEYILLALCLCVIALRTTYTEGPVVQSAALPANLSSNVYSLSISAILFLSFVFWFILGLCNKRFLYRFTAIEIGLCLFCIAVVSATFAASNKRAAITDAVCLTAPVLMAVLLVQILDSQSKIKLVLVVIAALGVVSACQCAEQFFVSNQVMIDQYEQDPQTMLESLGIQSGSFQQFLFEHRLYSRDIRGFFTTGNSAGSFAILASFAALALFIDKFKNRQSQSSLIKCGIGIAVVAFGLIITRSKGAIAASLIAAGLFVAFLYFGDWLKTHRKAILLVCLLFFIAAGWAVVTYGLTHHRLPGGSSMLVRWQYWRAAARMYADHWLTGVGPGNFAHFYTHYKPAAALETVADPHNFLLSILTQYGPLGLVGFLAMLFIPLWRAISSSSSEKSSSAQDELRSSFRILAITYLTIVSAALLLIRPLIMPVTVNDTFGVIIYVVFTLYIAPVIAFAVGFWLLTTPLDQTKASSITIAALFCALLGLLLHNLIDFAIFEPGVFTAFWAIAACIIALDHQQNSRQGFVLKPALFTRILLVVAGFLLIGAYFYYAWWPVAKTTKIQRQMRQFGYTHELLDKAAEDDRLDPTALNLNGRLYLQHYSETLDAQPALLKKAETCFLAAIARDKADFKNYEKLSEVYNLLGRTQKAHDWCFKATQLYPGSGRLHFELAQISEKLHKNNNAVQQYRKAVEIEDSYRLQFQIMYPERQIFSRLGEEKYNSAKRRIKFLTGQSAP
jgi:O-antigen ligase